VRVGDRVRLKGCPIEFRIVALHEETDEAELRDNHGVSFHATEDIEPYPDEAEAEGVPHYIVSNVACEVKI